MIDAASIYWDCNRQAISSLTIKDLHLERVRFYDSVANNLILFSSKTNDLEEVIAGVIKIL